MALLGGCPCTLFCIDARLSHGCDFGFASIGRGRISGRIGRGRARRSGMEVGSMKCSMAPGKDFLPAAGSVNHTRLGQGAQSGSLGHLLPGFELGSPVGGDAAPLLYKPYMDHLWATLAERAPGFKSLDLEPDFRRQTSRVGAKKSRVLNWLCSASRLRRIRMTYFDGGSALQAFNSLLYPDVQYDVPMLGIDLLSFGSSKILCVIDFTPLTQDPAYLDKYTSQLAVSRAKMAGHCGRMTTKFYDENQFFSKQLIFYRSELGPKDPILKEPEGLLFSTYVEYIDQYLQILQASEPNEDPRRVSYVASRQNMYNEHSEERDPAIKIFNKHFGEEWSERFTKEFLFQQTALKEEIPL